MSQRKRKVEERLETAEGAMALLGSVRLLLGIVKIKADYMNEPLRSSLMEDLAELKGLVFRAQEHVKRLVKWIEEG